MTEVSDIEVTTIEPLDEVLALIDEGLGGLSERQLVSASEVADLLLDVRMLLSNKDS